MKLRNLKPEEVKFSFWMEPMDLSPREIWQGTQDQIYYIEKYIEKQLESGNRYAWFCASCTASWEGFSATESLGCLCFINEQAWLESNYRANLQDQALKALNQMLQEDFQKISILMEE